MPDRPGLPVLIIATSEPRHALLGLDMQFRVTPCRDAVYPEDVL